MAYKKQKQSSYLPILRALQEDGPGRLYVLTGEDDYLLSDLADRLFQSCITPGMEDLDAVKIDYEGKVARFDLNRLEQDIRTPPFLSERRFVHVRRSSAFLSGGLSAEQMSFFCDLLQRIPDTTCLLFTEEKLDRRQKKLFQIVEQVGTAGEILHESAESLQRWVQADLSRRGIRMAPPTIENLIDRCASDMQLLKQELTKITTYCAATDLHTVDPALVDELCIPDMRGTIFNITDAVSYGDTGTAMKYLQILFERKEPGPLILFMLARHFKQLMYALDCRSEAELKEVAGVPPFVAARLRKQVKRFSWPKLEALYKACFDTDAAIKSGLIDERTALEILIAQTGRAAASRR